MPHEQLQARALEEKGLGSVAACRARLLLHSDKRFCLLAGVTLAVLALSLLGAIACGVQREGYFGADDLYAATLITDLVSWSGTLRDWRITPAPYVFPDLTLYLPVHLATPNVESAQYITGLSHLLLFVIFAFRLVRTVVAVSDVAAATVSIVLLPLLVLRIAEVLNVPGLGPLFRITNHGGAALISVALLARCLDASAWGPGCWLGMTGVSLLAGVSDPLFAASCAAPMLALGCVACVPRLWTAYMAPAEPGRRVLRNRLFVVALAGSLGASLNGRVHEHLNELRNIVLAKTRTDVWNGVWHDLTVGQPGNGAWMLTVVALCCATLLRRHNPAYGKLRILALWQIGSFITTPAAMIWTRNYLDAGSLRYLTVPFAMAPVTVAAILAHWVVVGRNGALSRRVVRLSTAAVVTAACASVVICTPLLVHGQFKSSWRAKARCVAAVLKRENVDAVLTDYWRCKPLRLFSRGEVHALQMRSKFNRPYFWISSRGWYRGEHHLGVIATNELRRDLIVRQYGEPAQSDRCDDVELITYRDGARAKLNAQMNRLFGRFLADPNPP